MSQFQDKIESILVKSGSNAKYEFQWLIAADMCDEAGEETLAQAIRYAISNSVCRISIEYRPTFSLLHDIVMHGKAEIKPSEMCLFRYGGLVKTKLSDLLVAIYLAKKHGAVLASSPSHTAQK